MKYITRQMETTIKKAIGSYPAIMVTGPRQVGKTTMLAQIAATSRKKINYVSLDDMQARLQANEDPALFLETHDTPLIIDEFQYAPNLLSYIKIKIDEARNAELINGAKSAGTLYYLTGSQSFQAMKNISESLAGRVAIFDLYALSSRELSGADATHFIPVPALLKKRTKTQNITASSIFKKIIIGGYPRLHDAPKVDREQYFRDYLNTYIERDIRQLINIKDENRFSKFIGAIAARTGQEFNANEITSEIGVTNKTIDEWLSILKNTGIVYLLQPYTTNSVSRAIKRPKLYFMDTGLACYLAGYLDDVTLSRSAFNGAIFETYVVSEIIKSFANDGKDPRRHLYYYRDSNKREIDLIIIENNIIYPIEIKKSTNPDKDAIKNFYVAENFEQEIGSGSVICLANELSAIAKNAWRVPVEYI